MSDLEARILAPPDYDAWNQFVEDSPQGTIFATSYWLEATGWPFAIYGTYRQGNLVGGLPVGIRQLSLGLRSGEHPPLTPYLGVIHQAREAKYVQQISSEKETHDRLAIAVKQDFDWIRFNFHPAILDLQPFIWAGFSSSVRYTYWLDIKDLSRVWDDMEKRRRNDIHRAERDSVLIEKTENFEDFFALVEKTFARQEMQAGFRTAATKIHQMLKNRKQSQIFAAYDAHRRPIAGVYIIWDWKRAYYLMGGYDPELGHTGASALALWKAIQFVSEELQLPEFDFEGSMVPAVEQFFRKFGGKLTPYYSVAWAKPALDLALQLRSGLKRLVRRDR